MTFDAGVIVGRVDLEVTPSGANHARVDVTGCISNKGCWPDFDRKSTGGRLVLRITRKRALEFTVWTELAH